jgi:hypothetical protein
MFRLKIAPGDISKQVIAGLIVAAALGVWAWISPAFLRFTVSTAAALWKGVAYLVASVAAHKYEIGSMLLGAVLAAPYVYRSAYRHGRASAVRDMERQAAMLAASDPTLSADERKVVQCLALADGAPILIGELQIHFGWGFLQTSIILGELASKGLTEKVTDLLLNELTSNVRIRLTGLGVDYVRRHGMIPRGD